MYDIDSEYIVLASVSPRRRRLFAEFKLPYICVEPVFEELDNHISPLIIPLLNAEGKALSISKLYPENWIISADTVIEFEDEIIGKPSDIADAERFLLRFSGKTHRVVTGVCICRGSCYSVCMFTEESLVRFRGLDKTLIADYLKKVNPVDKAGGYAIDEYSDMIIESISGSRTNVSGLPMEKLAKSLQALGIGSSIRSFIPSCSGLS